MDLLLLTDEEFAEEVARRDEETEATLMAALAELPVLDVRQ